MENREKDFWEGKEELLKFHNDIKLEIARLRLGFEVIKQMTEKENDDYRELTKMGMEKWNSLYEKLNKTTDEAKKSQLIQEMNQIKTSIDEINQARIKLEEIMHSIFK
ncbi:MAG: hypothetical protein MRECE_36c009 [Mycoplasmataceae bacterium CE_OT135]|nr:MAG: hypothetical protein MRECE_36c009 [Mycoplasmataceae bacterium CE_OT135]